MNKTKNLETIRNYEKLHHAQCCHYDAIKYLSAAIATKYKNNSKCVSVILFLSGGLYSINNT